MSSKEFFTVTETDDTATVDSGAGAAESALTVSRLDQAITSHANSLQANRFSRSQIQKAIKAGDVSVAGRIITDPAFKVKQNDAIGYIVIEETLTHLAPLEYPLDVVYEDEDLIVINKPHGMSVHPGAGREQDSLANVLVSRTHKLSDIGGCFRPGIVHRLDRDTSGLMLVAKNNYAHRHLAAQIQDKSCTRKYLALIFGMLKPASGTLEGNIGRSRTNRKLMTSLKVGGKPAITHYKTLEIFAGGGCSLVECQLETGRTHQIRVHLSHCGHSIVGDQTYGNNNRKIGNLAANTARMLYDFRRQALHSYYIRFKHPQKDSIMEFEKAPPLDYNELIEKLRG